MLKPFDMSFRMSTSTVKFKITLGFCFRVLIFCVKGVKAQDSSTDNSQTPVECLTRDGLTPEVTSVAADWLETEVAAGFRIWQLMFLALAGLICLVVFLCCCMKCRIPRTKQEIEADFIRKRLCKRFRTHLNKLSLEDDTNFRGALEKVKQLCEKEPSPTAKKSKKKDKETLEGAEDLTGSQSALVTQPAKMTFMEKLRKLLSPAQRESQDAEEIPEVVMGESDIIVKITDTGSTDSSNSQEPISIVGITVELARDDDDDDDEKKGDSNSVGTKSSTQSDTDSDVVQPSEDSYLKSKLKY